ncbi:MAG: efflux RND transporter periplasmic adaptor subunit [Tychonema bourrellyi B0820]|uniref:Efflux RND transporter periplasmic adaptor subunit n=1 Tax=Tychonema bourrellyi FEM_GT703 TaxID=2040638 RepID=A0A2G4EW79_9CYAN|nr:efflux RND transporter periplasmic adaptor subunit [Tychonema bourrellyi]MDQ2098243.1 efflux RND transporter periplasmic adaptor subunit [Tychonema bourrellyi B0820]PHX53728.1 efflux RND transporter periplasmic adaptor subunit [Tychonema bourrellyi FEM_GT703]
MIVSPKKETAQVKVEDTKSADTKAAETKITDKKTAQKQSPKKPAPKSKRWAIALVAAGLIAVPATMYIVNSKSKPKVDAIATMTVPVEAQNLTVRITSSGTVQPVQRVNLSPKGSGRIAELFVEQGDKVEAGQIIARMESRDVEAQLAQAIAREASVRAKLAKIQAGNRSEDIASAQARLDQAQASLAQLQAGSRVEEVAGARARLQQTQANLQKLRTGTRVEEVSQGRAKLAQAQARLADAQTGSSKQEIAQAQSQIDSSKAQAELTTKRVERNRSLVQEGALAQDKLDELIKENRTAQAKVIESQKRLEQLQENRLSQIQQLQAAVEVEQQGLKQLQNGTRSEEIAKSEAEVAEAKSKLAQVENGSRPEEIAKAEAAVAEAKSQFAVQENGSRPEEIAQAQAELAEVQAQVRYQEVQLEDTKVRAPFAGVITQRYAIQGAFVTPATSASEATSATSTSIVALARDVEVLAKVPEADISQIKPGQEVEIVADAYPDKVFKGKVKLIAPEAVKERDVTLFQVRVAIDTGKDLLQSGMNVDLRFVGQKLSNALVVPTVAIVTNKGQTGVLVPDEKQQPKFQAVTVGSTIGNKIQILEGAKAGDRVFTELPQGKKLEDIIKNQK